MPSIEIVERKKIFLNCILYIFIIIIYIFLFRLLVDCNNSHAMLCNQFHNNNSTCTFWDRRKVCLLLLFWDFYSKHKYEFNLIFVFAMLHFLCAKKKTFTFSYASFKCLEDLLVLVKMEFTNKKHKCYPVVYLLHFYISFLLAISFEPKIFFKK